MYAATHMRVAAAKIVDSRRAGEEE